MPTETFELPIRILPRDIDELGHVNNVVYLRWVQEAAVAHWRHAASLVDQEKLAWVVVRHEIDYKRSAGPDDEIVARTWIGTARATFERLTEIVRTSDDEILARARTVWCPIDAVTGKPTLASRQVREQFSSD
jgi:acyl-CoA thioester hydrolase